MGAMRLLDRLKYFFEKLFRGYSDYDLIDCNKLIARKVLPPLKAWVKSKRYGYPQGLKSKEEWDAILQKILWSLEELATEKHENEVLYDEDMDPDTQFEKTMAIWDDTQEGLELFGKYLGAMWD
jgi:hypothetical protein